MRVGRRGGEGKSEVTEAGVGLTVLTHSGRAEGSGAGSTALRTGREVKPSSAVIDFDSITS